MQNTSKSIMEDGAEIDAHAGAGEDVVIGTDGVASGNRRTRGDRRVAVGQLMGSSRVVTGGCEK